MALGITLTSLSSQSFSDYSVTISDQSSGDPPWMRKEIQAIVRVLEIHRHEVCLLRHVPRRGMAEQRHFLLGLAKAPYSLFLDDDVILEPYVMANMVKAIQEEGCGFVGSAVIGLSFRDDIRPAEQRIEWWEGGVRPERVRPGTGKWQRYRLHNAANLYHVQQRLGVSAKSGRKYRVAWTGGCVIYDTAKLRDVGGFSFWEQLPPEHCGEDVYAQVRVMERYGGCGLIPSGVYHQELPTTVPDRRVNAPDVLGFDFTE